MLKRHFPKRKAVFQAVLFGLESNYENRSDC